MNLDPRHLSLYSSCFVDEYLPWTTEDLQLIIENEYQSMVMPSTIESIVKTNEIYLCLSRIHLMMNEYEPFSMKYLQQMSKFFVKYLEEIQTKENLHFQRIESILERTKKSEKIIQNNQKFIEDLEKQISNLKDKLTQLNELFQSKRTQFTTVRSID